MVLETGINRIKNIIFFKFVSCLLVYVLFIYLMNIFSDQLTNSQVRYYKAETLFAESSKRLEALQAKNQFLTSAVEKYIALRNDNINNNQDCFNYSEFRTKLKQVETKYNLQDSAKLFISSGSVAKKLQPKTSVTLKSTTVKVNYFINSYYDAVLFACDTFSMLPQYSVVQSLEIKDYEILTPQIAKWLSTAKQPNLISATLSMEVREIDLND